MALFGKKKEKKQKSGTTSTLPPVTRDISRIIVRPIISEKSARMGEKNVYIFEVARTASKFDVRDAVRKLWNVVPAKITIVNRPPRTYLQRAKNRVGTEPGMKKAYVYLREGDTIELV